MLRLAFAGTRKQFSATTLLIQETTCQVQAQNKGNVDAVLKEIGEDSPVLSVSFTMLLRFCVFKVNLHSIKGCPS
jgi:hypothetical protein